MKDRDGNSHNRKPRTAALIIGIALAVLLITIVGFLVWAEYGGGLAWFQNRFFPVAVDKPVIYVYPEKETQLSIRFPDSEKISVSYPDYASGWNFTAFPDGSLTADGKTYPYLYYEFEASVEFGDKGFVVAGIDAASFLEEKLDDMGFGYREKTDFITYWLPRLSANEYNRIEFLTGEKLDALMPITIDPEPDSVFRVYMLFSSCGEDLELEPQSLPRFVKNGFSVLEWGGSELH